MARSESIQGIHDALAEYEASPDGRCLTLQLDLARIVIRRLVELGWTYQDLANKASVPEETVSLVLNSEFDCTLGMIGKLLFALDIHLKFETSDGR